MSEDPAGGAPVALVFTLAAGAVAVGAGIAVGAPLVAGLGGAVLLAAGIAGLRLVSGANREAANARRRLREAERLATIGLTTAAFAHELKNGTMVAHGFAELALKAATAAGDAKVRSQVAEVEAQTLRMVTQLRSFLRLARGEEMDQVQRPLGDVLEELASLSRALARMQDRSFEAQLEGGLDIVVPDPAVRGAILNLILNALQHCRSEVLLTADRVGRSIEVAVEDDGAGVAPAMRARLFDRFASDSENGTGLGLASAREAVEREGGTLTLESGKVGARFVVRLPDRP